MTDQLLSREEVLGGLPARRAATVLHAIRARTAASVARSRRPLGGYVGERGAAQRESEFLAALASGRDSRARPSVQHLERYAHDWTSLVPDQPATRAAVADRLGAEERLPRERVPRLRAALRLDEEETRAAYERATGKPLDSVYSADASVAEGWAWRRSALAERIEHIPPFWIAFALTLTECVGAGILALPVAMAGIGPLGAAILIVVFGAVNVLTVAALAEAIARTGPMRYGSAYFGRLVGEHFGRSGVGLLGASVFALNAAMFVVALIGFGSVLASLIGLPLWLWATILFAADLALLARERLEATIASAVVVGVINIVLILALAVIALGQAKAANFDHVNVPLLDGRPVDTEVLALVFGVLLLAFFGHTSAANSAKIVLERDPSGRALLRGNVMALGTATVLYAITAVSFGGALDPHVLQGATGTALEPLAEHSGFAVELLGSIFAVLAIGMGSVYAALGLYNQLVEWRPQQDRRRRFAMGAAVPALLFVFVMWLVAADRESFTDPLGYAGALTVPLVGGVMPMVLIVASRRRGDQVPPVVPRLIGNPLVAALVAGLFMAAVLLHGLVIWDEPLAQAAALAVAVVMAAAVAGAWRLGAFRPRTVIELRREPERDLGVVRVAAAGRELSTAVALDGRPGTTGPFEQFSRVGSVEVDLPPGTPDEVHVWAHRVSTDGESEDVPVTVSVSGGQVVIRP
ncbi:MAG TPA: aromatic amino acid transport family protein [Thermoleophilaceae bacterium]